MLQAYVGRSSQSIRNISFLKVHPEPFNFTWQRQQQTNLVLCRCAGFFSHCCSPQIINNKCSSSTHNRYLRSKLSNSIVPLNNCHLHKFELCKRYFSVTTKYTDNKENSSSIRQTKGTNEVINKSAPPPDLDDIKSEWETVYRFKYIRQARGIQKLKIYQTAFTCFLALPGSLGLYFYEFVPVEAVAFMLASSVLACGMLYTMGQFCARLIGILYISKNDNTIVKVAHLNFWGRREDQIISKTDFIPFSELPDNVADIYVNLRFYSDREKKLHICVKHGTVYIKDEFEGIFGVHGGLDIIPKRQTSEK